MSRHQGRKIEMKQTGKTRVTEASDGRLSISIPIQIKRRCTTRITLPENATQTDAPTHKELTVLQKALVRGHRWLQMLASGACDSLQEIARKEGVDNSYVGRMINLTTLAPDIVEAILDDTLPSQVKLSDLTINPPRLWSEQRALFL